MTSKIDQYILLSKHQPMFCHPENNLYGQLKTSMEIEKKSVILMHILGNKDTHCPRTVSNVVAEAKQNNITYFVYTWPAVCTEQLINTWHKEIWRINSGAKIQK